MHILIEFSSVAERLHTLSIKFSTLPSLQSNFLEVTSPSLETFFCCITSVEVFGVH